MNILPLPGVQLVLALRLFRRLNPLRPIEQALILTASLDLQIQIDSQHALLSQEILAIRRVVLGLCVLQMTENLERISEQGRG